MTTPPTRFVPHRELPAHAFVPGRTARPPRRAHGAERELAAALPPERWREDEDYLFGVDLYHAGFYWEAHEAWERPWLASGDERQRLCLQALIQLAAACLKLEMDEPSGAAKLARTASDKLRALGPGEFMGLAPKELASAIDAFFAGSPANAAGRPALVLDADAASRPRHLP